MYYIEKYKRRKSLCRHWHSWEENRRIL